METNTANPLATAPIPQLLRKYSIPTTLTLLVNEENSFKVSMARYIASNLTTSTLSVQVEMCIRDRSTKR